MYLFLLWLKGQFMQQTGGFGFMNQQFIISIFSLQIQCDQNEVCAAYNTQK